MGKGAFSGNSVSIGRESNNNMVLQDVSVNNLIVGTAESRMYEVLSNLKQYEAIQEIFLNTVNAVKKTHPLYPEYSATYSDELERLVSTPETADALEKYPRRIEGTYQLDYKKYPNMDKSETPWEYAYRTQTTVEMTTKAYQEYLGDIEDPFPVMKYTDGMITGIIPPSFPEAMEATISAGDVEISVMIQRKPSMEYGEFLFGTVSTGHGFIFDIRNNRELKKSTVFIGRLNDCDLTRLLQREELLIAIKQTKGFTIKVGEKTLLSTTIDEEELNGDLFNSAPFFRIYLKSLLVIEEKTSCHFNTILDEISEDECRLAHIMATSLNEKWYAEKKKFDDEVRCDYDNVPDDIDDVDKMEKRMVATMHTSKVSLHGRRFSVEKYIIVYEGARINNIDSVLRNKKRRKKNILFTIKPVLGQERFNKYCRLEGIKAID